MPRKPRACARCEKKYKEEGIPPNLAQSVAQLCPGRGNRAFCPDFVPERDAIIRTNQRTWTVAIQEAIQEGLRAEDHIPRQGQERAQVAKEVDAIQVDDEVQDGSDVEAAAEAETIQVDGEVQDGTDVEAAVSSVDDALDDDAPLMTADAFNGVFG
ncbi:MAG: hypothetical protein SGARI_004515 [Bacillariaceae sp.]